MHSVIIYQHWDSMQEVVLLTLPTIRDETPLVCLVPMLVGLVSSIPLFSVKSDYISCDFSLCFSWDKS
jgi:hypothetical protein